MVAFRYPTVNWKRSLFVHRCHCWTVWQPVEWKQ
jgi:hypothetical protein